MPLIYVTGISGSGKTTVCHELKTRGFEAYDIESDGLVEWRDTKTNKKLRFPHLRKSLRLHSWYRSHVPYLDLSRVGSLKDKADATHSVIYLCGSAYGEDQARRYFDSVIVLTADLDTLKTRIAHRRNTVYGKSADELEDIEQWYIDAEAGYVTQQVLRVDATKPLETVVASVINMVDKKHRPHR